MKLEQRIKRKMGWTFRRKTSSFRILPNFLISGFPRCGTTSLFNYVLKHPCVLAPLAKESGFFISKDFASGLRFYKSYFPLLIQKKYNDRKNKCMTITGEADPMYVLHPKAPLRIKKVLPSIKIIFLLRNPIDRAVSHYNSIKKRGLESLSFEEAITIEEKRLNGEYEKMLNEENYYSMEWHFHGYLSCGHYMQLLRNWFNTFGKDKILIIKSEDMYKNPSAVFNKTCTFLGLSKIDMPSYQQFNASDSRTEIDPLLRNKLREYFKPHNEKLCEYLEEDFQWN